MIIYKTSSFVNYKQKISESIFNWSNGREKVVNVINPPYTSPDIFLKVILSYVQSGKKILYITEERENNIQIINFIKKYSNFREYSYIRNSFGSVNALLNICNYKNAIRINEKYDLVIYDDCSCFSEYNNYEIMDLAIKCVKKEGKIICSSIEGIFKNQRDIIIPTRGNKRPLAEPRYVITRIDLDKEIPYLFYDYLNFSIENDRKVVVYVSNSEKVHSVFSYLSNFRTSLSKNIMYYINNESDEKILYNFALIKRAILVTNDYKDRFVSLNDTDIVVYSSDDLFFNYKKLVYFCGKAGRSDKLRNSEVIFLANSENDNMDKAKSVIRHFNKEAWEMGLLDL